MRGSVVKFGVTGLITEAKKLSVVVLRTPSARPVALLKVLIRPFTATTNCVGPIAPIESGGNAPVSATVAPVNFVDGVCAAARVGNPRALLGPSPALACSGRVRIPATQPARTLHPNARTHARTPNGHATL